MYQGETKEYIVFVVRFAFTVSITVSLVSFKQFDTDHNQACSTSDEKYGHKDMYSYNLQEKNRCFWLVRTEKD